MSAAKVRVLALALLAAASADRLRAQPFPPPVASYQITCRLDTEKKTVEGTEVLAWKNTTSRPAATLRLHLYLNAFRNTLSTFWRESGGEHRDGVLPDSWGSIEISRMTGPDGADLLPAMRFVAPDDGNANDRTVAEVILPRPVQPGETISVAMDFVSVLPRVSVRTGYKDDFFMVVQWFPKIGVFEEKGWNCHQFHASTEFFSDFGNYDVSIDVPARYKGKVGATGQRVDERETSAGRVLYRFRQQGVHDFAWTADPSYLVLVDAFREAGLGDVQLLLYLQPEHASQAERYFRAAKAALSGYGRVLGGYPVRHAVHRGSALGRARRGRHGVPDADHRRHRLERAERASIARGRDGPRGRTPVLLRPARLQRVRGGLARRGLQHVHDRPRHERDLRTPTTWTSASSASTSRSASTSTTRWTRTGATSRSPTGTCSPRRAGSSATGAPTEARSTRRRP